MVLVTVFYDDTTDTAVTEKLSESDVLPESLLPAILKLTGAIFR